MLVALSFVEPATIASMHVESASVALVHTVSVRNELVHVALESVVSESTAPVHIMLVPEK